MLRRQLHAAHRAITVALNILRGRSPPSVSDDVGVKLDFCLVSSLLEGYDEPEILRSSSRQFCLTSAEAGQKKDIRPAAPNSCVQSCADPTVSAIVAPRAPNGLGRPLVVSCVVWCSISASHSAPMRITAVDNQIHTMKPTAAPSDP